MKETNLPAIDDLDLRKKQSERFVNGIEQVGTYFQETLKQSKISFWTGLIFMSLILFLLIGGFIVLYKTGNGSIFDKFWDTDSLKQRYDCNLNGQSIIFRDITKVKDFLLVYPQSVCKYYQVGK